MEAPGAAAAAVTATATGAPSSAPPAVDTPRATPEPSQREWGSRTVDVYNKLDQIGEGTYGFVYKAVSKTDPTEFVALKKIRMDTEREGFPITAIREIKILRELDHKNIVKLKEIVTQGIKKENAEQAKEKTSKSIYMVFEYMDHDLSGLMDSTEVTRQWFSPAQVKCYMRQLLEGLNHCHKMRIVHRDIKASNLLISNDGVLKLGDFGLARPIDDREQMTNRVITLWYRPPELLLGSTLYTQAVDMWSVGCILAELLTRRSPFPGKTEPDELDLILRVCGSPTEDDWPDVIRLKLYPTIKGKNFKRKLREIYRDLDRHALDLLDRLLTLNPANRLTAEKALDCEWFWTDPRPADPKDLPKYQQACHEWVQKKRRQALQQQQQQAGHAPQPQAGHSSQARPAPMQAGVQPAQKRQKDMMGNAQGIYSQPGGEYGHRQQHSGGAAPGHHAPYPASGQQHQAHGQQRPPAPPVSGPGHFPAPTGFHPQQR
eukprot:m51a1_g1281 putative cyclin-dependent kinase c-2-like (488) ;mRNA; r:129173-130959